MPPEPAGRTVAAEVGRRALPGGRAVVGALLIVLAAVGVLVANRAASDGPRTSFLVLRVDVDAGATIERSDLQEVRIDLPVGVAEQSFAGSAAVEGSIALVPLSAGQLLARTAVRPPDGGSGSAAAPSRQFSFAVDRARALDGDLRRGDRIDLLATYGDGVDAGTVVAARDVPVIRIGDEGKGGIGTASEIVLTIALVDAAAVTEVAHAATVARLTVVRSTGAGSADGSADRYVLPDRPRSGAGDPEPAATGSAPKDGSR